MDLITLHSSVYTFVGSGRLHAHRDVKGLEAQQINTTTDRLPHFSGENSFRARIGRQNCTDWPTLPGRTSRQSRTSSTTLLTDVFNPIVPFLHLWQCQTTLKRADIPTFNPNCFITRPLTYNCTFATMIPSRSLALIFP